jgi:DNA ligase D-like protein (predicted ligase)
MKRRREVTVFSRRGNKLNHQFPSIARAFSFLPDDTIVDGEIVATDDEGTPSFAALQKSQSSKAPLYFYVFDVLVYRGKDVTKLPLHERRELLKTSVLAKITELVRLSPVLDAAPRTIVASIRKQRLEGVIAKRANSSYEAGERSGAWVKYKTNQGQELVIGGYKPGPGYFEYLLVGYYEGRDFIFVGKIKNGFVPALRRELSKFFKGLETKVCPFANLPEAKNARRGEALTAEVMQKMNWLKPKLVAQIEFTEWTKGNHLRHSKFGGLRNDKVAKNVTREAARSD